MSARGGGGLRLDWYWIRERTVDAVRCLFDQVVRRTLFTNRYK